MPSSANPPADYHARREALAKKLNGGIAILFAANEPASNIRSIARTKTSTTSLDGTSPARRC